MILLCSKNQQDALFCYLFLFLNRLTTHYQEVALLNMQHMVFIMHLCWLAASTNAIIEIIEIN